MNPAHVFPRIGFDGQRGGEVMIGCFVPRDYAIWFIPSARSRRDRLQIGLGVALFVAHEKGDFIGPDNIRSGSR